MVTAGSLVILAAAMYIVAGLGAGKQGSLPVSENTAALISRKEQTNNHKEVYP